MKRIAVALTLALTVLPCLAADKVKFKKDFGKEVIEAIRNWLSDQGRPNDISHWTDMPITIEDANEDGLHTSQEIADTVNGFINPNTADPRFELDIDNPDVRYVWYQGQRICLHGFMMLIKSGNVYVNWKLPSTHSVKMQVWATLSWATAITATGSEVPPMN